MICFGTQEEKLKGKPGYEHLNEQLHILIEADLPADIVDIKLRHAQEIIEELVKPVVCALTHFFSIIIFRGHKILNGLRIFVQDESQDYIKRQQLRELALLNSNLRENSPGPSGSVSPFNSNAMKRPKTGR